MKNICLFVLILIISCHQGESNKIISKKSYIEKCAELKAELVSLKKGQSIVEGSIGILTYNTEISQSIEVSFFNDNGTLWDSLEIEFQPFSWHPDYGTLALRCIKIKNDTCKVIVNEEKMIIKNYTLKNKGLIFQTWEQHILSLFAVGFDEQKNPIKESPIESAQTKYFEKDEFYHPVEIKNDWLKIKWGSYNNWEYGWIKWKYKNSLLIELFYFA